MLTCVSRIESSTDEIWTSRHLWVFPNHWSSCILCQMLRSVLSVLFLGMLPVAGTQVGQTAIGLEGLTVAPPVPPLVLEERLSASGAIILDLRSAQEVYGQAEDVERPMASLTKLMTALLIVENHDLGEWVKIPHLVADVGGQKAYLPGGEHFTVGDLLSALLLLSANDAAETLAIYHSGSVSDFVREMNERAVSLGLRETSYANPTGLDDEDQYSTPRDIAWITTFVTRQPEIRERMSMRADTIWSREGSRIDLWHTHALLHTEESVVAGKTGTTGAAGQCLVSLVAEGGREYVVVLLHSQERYADLRTILRSLEPTVVSARLGM